MHVSGPMIVRINHNPKSVYFIYPWHNITKPKRLGYFLVGPNRSRAVFSIRARNN